MEGEGEINASAGSERTAVENLSDSLRERGLQARIVKAVNGKEIVVIDHEEREDNLISVYRGVVQRDAESITNQVSYLLRKREEDGNVIVREDIREDVKSLLDQPTFDKLQNIYNRIIGDALPVDKRMYQDDLRKIEDDILDGRILRASLGSIQALHGGGYGALATSGLGPYVSASYNLEDARGYSRANGALLVISLPASQIEDWSSEREIGIKGWLDPEYIDAIIPAMGPDTPIEEVNSLVALAKKETGVVTLDAESRKSARAEVKEEERVWNGEHQKSDLGLVRKKRVDALMDRFDALDWSDFSGYSQADYGNEDIYKKAQEKVYDYYKSRLTALQSNPEESEMRYTSYVGLDKPISRGAIDYEMLTTLLKLAEENGIQVNANDFSVFQLSRVSRALSKL
jgi:hypothetical protein